MTTVFDFGNFDWFNDAQKYFSTKNRISTKIPFLLVLLWL